MRLKAGLSFRMNLFFILLNLIMFFVCLNIKSNEAAIILKYVFLFLILISIYEICFKPFIEISEEGLIVMRPFGFSRKIINWSNIRLINKGEKQRLFYPRGDNMVPRYSILEIEDKNSCIKEVNMSDEIDNYEEFIEVLKKYIPKERVQEDPNFALSSKGFLIKRFFMKQRDR